MMQRNPFIRFEATRPRWRALPLLLAAAALCCACGPSKPARRAAGKELRTFRVEEALPESPQPGLFARAGVTHYGLLSRIRDVATAGEVSALLLQVGALGGSWGRASDLADALAAVRKAGKPVHCYFEVTDNLGFALLARACDRISMAPGGHLDLTGVSAQAVYAHELLQNAGLTADLIQIGEFKGAADALTRDEMPPEVAATVNAILDDLHGELLRAIEAGRKLPAARVQQLIDSGPFTAAQALAAGLIDDVGFDDEARAHAKRAGKAARVVEEELRPKDEEIGLGDLIRALASDDDDDDEARGPRLVLAYLDGTILRGAPGSWESAHAESFVSAMREFADDADVKAVVLRIDSPGGSALAADLMWHAVRRVAKRKPVIVSLGDLAASGGYYVAAAGTEIVAQDHSLVGSIGVVGGKIVAEELADRIGIHVTHLARGANAGWSSPARKWSPQERSVFERMLRDTYDRFLMRVAAGRGKSRSEIEPLAEGRLMTARRAREGGLVDHEGGIVEALARARSRARLPDTAAIEVWPEQPGLLQALSQLTSGAAESELRSALLGPVLRSVPRAAVVDLLLSPEGLRAAAILPYVLSLR